jgi:superfamily I DNA/RNA helicase
MQYTPEQLTVINHYMGPLCVVAAAGSGKTSS